MTCLGEQINFLPKPNHNILGRSNSIIVSSFDHQVCLFNEHLWEAKRSAIFRIREIPDWRLNCNNESSPGDEVDSSQQPLLSAVLTRARKKKYLAKENSRHLATLPLVFSNSECRNSVLMTLHYPDLGSASDWWNQISYVHDKSEAPPRSGE